MHSYFQSFCTPLLKVSGKMDSYEELFLQTTGQYCTYSESSYACAGCVCDYRNELLNNNFISEITTILENIKTEGSLLFPVEMNTTGIIDDFQINTVTLWNEKNTCKKKTRFKNKTHLFWYTCLKSQSTVICFNMSIRITVNTTIIQWS